MGTDLPYAAEAEMTLSPDELEVCLLPSASGLEVYYWIGPKKTILPRDRTGTRQYTIEIQLR